MVQKEKIFSETPDSLSHDHSGPYSHYAELSANTPVFVFVLGFVVVISFYYLLISQWYSIPLYEYHRPYLSVLLLMNVLFGYTFVINA